MARSENGKGKLSQLLRSDGSRVDAGRAKARATAAALPPSSLPPTRRPRAPVSASWLTTPPPQKAAEL